MVYFVAAAAYLTIVVLWLTSERMMVPPNRRWRRRARSIDIDVSWSGASFTATEITDRNGRNAPH